MIVSITFDTTEDLQSIRLARLLLDLQHLTVMVTTLASFQESVGAGVLPVELALDDALWKYKTVIELPSDYFGPLTAFVDGISKQSPLTVDLLLKLPKALATAIKSNVQMILHRIFFGDLERTKLSLENDKLREEVIGKRLENLSSAFGLAQKILDPALRQQFERNLIGSMRPFWDEHPPVKSLDLKD